MSLRNISKDLTINNLKRTKLKGYADAFIIDYNIIDTNGILGIHKLDIHTYLMKITYTK